MKKILQIIFVVMAISYAAKARSQNNGYTSKNNYTNSAGLRLGTENGVTFKHFYRPTRAIEATLTTGYRAFVATVLVEKHIELFRTDGLNLYYGGGGHIGNWGEVAYYRYKKDNADGYYVKSYRSVPSIGADGIIGVEYKFPKAPFTIGADLKPFLDVFYPYDGWVEGAFSFRYTFE